MIALLRSTDGQPDSRFEKYVDFLKLKKIPYVSICWDRLGVKSQTANNIYYKKPSKYGLRFGNIRNLIGFNCFLLKELIKKRKSYQVIHAADFDTILPAICMKLFFGKKVIYDIYDWYIDSRGLFHSKLKYLIKAIEFVNIKLSDMVIICEPERESQIEFKPKNLQILPNIPNFQNKISSTPKLRNQPITIAYVGILGGNRGLENLIKLCEHNPHIFVKVGGFGPLEESFLIAANRLANLDFRGRLNYRDALALMNESDVIYAMYERSNPNHILAAPNKFYEALYLGKPIITTVGTLVGKKVEKNKTGVVIEEPYESLEQCIATISKDRGVLNEYAFNANHLWESKYKNYVNNFLNDVYCPFIKKEARIER